MILEPQTKNHAPALYRSGGSPRVKESTFYRGEMRRQSPVFHSSVAQILTEFQEIQQKM